jgi:hypothetical protein
MIKMPTMPKMPKMQGKKPPTKKAKKPGAGTGMVITIGKPMGGGGMTGGSSTGGGHSGH